jgi:putative heme-binding domain-containing protein
VQGGYFQKGFSKHGPLSNPYAFGYFPAMKHDKVPRFTHNFIIYDGGSLPEKYNGKLFGVAPLLFHVVMSDVEQDGSSFKTKDIGHAVTSSDPWFRPVDIKLGPDGAVYVADLYEAQVSHLKINDGQLDPSNGRIYRIKAKGAKPLAPFDLARQTSSELLNTLKHPNRWMRDMALRVLADRRDASVIPALKTALEEQTGQPALEALWGVAASGGFNDAVALQVLDHQDPYVRLWTVRLLADEQQVSPTIARKLAEMARTEPHLEVRSQLACSAKRLPAASGLPMVRNLCSRDEDATDIHIPLLLWWAIEAKCETDPESVLALFDDANFWRAPLVSSVISQRVMQRFAMTGSRKDLLVCARLLKLAPDNAAAAPLLKGFEEAFKGRPLTNLPPELIAALEARGGGSEALALRQGRAEVLEKALKQIADETADKAVRLQFIQILGEVKQPRSVPVLLGILEKSKIDELKQAALISLQQYDAAEIGTQVLRLLNGFSDDVRGVALTLLVSRKPWTLELISAAEADKIDRTKIPLDTVRRMTVHRDERIAVAVEKLWGPVAGATTGEMQEQMAKLTHVLGADVGNPYPGKKLFGVTCAKCHQLFGQGGLIGPDLTTFKRDDLGNMLLNVVNPSAEIREGFENLLIVTTDGRTITGFLVDKDQQVVVLRGTDGQNITIAQDQIEEMLPQRKSLMPEGLLKELSEQQVRDLFAYLRSTQPLND